MRTKNGFSCVAPIQFSFFYFWHFRKIFLVFLIGLVKCNSVRSSDRLSEDMLAFKPLNKLSIALLGLKSFFNGLDSGVAVTFWKIGNQFGRRLV